MPATLVLLGNVATDDPEGEMVYQSLQERRDDRIVILSVQARSWSMPYSGVLQWFCKNQFAKALA